MSRAAVTHHTKEVLLRMSVAEIDAYISWLRQRVDLLGTLPAKSVAKHLAVAEKVRRQVAG
jgi:hypothetical protein